MIETPDARLSTLDVLSPSERDWLVRDVNAGAPVRPTGTLVEWFESDRRGASRAAPR